MAAAPPAALTARCCGALHSVVAPGRRCSLSHGAAEATCRRHDASRQVASSAAAPRAAALIGAVRVASAGAALNTARVCALKAARRTCRRADSKVRHVPRRVRAERRGLVAPRHAASEMRLRQSRAAVDVLSVDCGALHDRAARPQCSPETACLHTVRSKA
jgi:hypothetical protein